jgi:hypothetical protein
VLDIYRDIKPFSFSSVQASNIKNSSYPTSREEMLEEVLPHDITAVDPYSGSHFTNSPTHQNLYILCELGSSCKNLLHKFKVIANCVISI